MGIQSTDKQEFKSNVAQVDDEIFGSNVQVNAFDDELLQPAVVEEKTQRQSANAIVNVFHHNPFGSAVNTSDEQ